MNIRLEQEKDYFNVEDLTREAFWNVYRPGCMEHYVVHNLRKDKDPDDDLTSMRRRVYFVVDDQVPPHLKMLENCLIRNDDKEAGFLKAQWPVHCNF